MDLYIGNEAKRNGELTRIRLFTIHINKFINRREHLRLYYSIQLLTTLLQISINPYQNY